MFALRRVFFWQLTAWLVCILVAFAVGVSAALSAFLGGAVCALPSFAVIGVLFLSRNKPASPLGIFVVEFFKVSLTIFGFLCVALFCRNLHWLSFILTFSAVLLSHLFALAGRS